ncbi:MAG: hypothetical protein D6806_02750, partial [Deltaproteobacteria bacterium]
MRGGELTPLSYLSDPEGLPVEQLKEELAEAGVPGAGSKLAKTDAVSVVARSPVLYRLLEDIENDEVDAGSFPSLADLDKTRRLAAFALAAADIAGLDADWQEFVRLVYGDGKTVGEVARVIFENCDGVAYEWSGREGEFAGVMHELLSYAYGVSHEHPGEDDAVGNPVVQWLLSLGAISATGAEECLSADVQNMLLRALGDHTPPDEPEVSLVAAGDRSYLLRGHTEPWGFIEVEGSTEPAFLQSSEEGAFEAQVGIQGGSALSIVPIDLSGNEGEPVLLRAGGGQASQPE